MEHITILRDLLKIKSVSGKESNILNYIFKNIKALGLMPFFVEGNLVVKIDGKDSSKALIFNAHVDTVSPGDTKTWKYSPFEGHLVNNKMYGLGASDDKSGVAVLMLLAKYLEATKSLQCDVWLTFVVKEELDGSGTKSFLNWFEEKGYKRKYKNLSAILLEPTDFCTLELGHRGNVFVSLTTRGNSGHGSQPKSIKIHSVLAMMNILQEIQKIEKKWIADYSHSLLGSPSVGITSIHAGDIHVPNKFPETCVLTLDIRTTPTLHAIVLKELKKSLKEYPVDIEFLYEPAPFGLTSKESPIVSAIRTILDDRVKLSISKGSTDQCFFTKRDISAVVFGPGERKTIHQPNEYCHLDNITKSLDMFMSLIDIWPNIKAQNEIASRRHRR